MLYARFSPCILLVSHKISKYMSFLLIVCVVVGQRQNHLKSQQRLSLNRFENNVSSCVNFNWKHLQLWNMHWQSTRQSGTWQVSKLQSCSVLISFSSQKLLDSVKQKTQFYDVRCQHLIPQQKCRNSIIKWVSWKKPTK